MTVEGLELVERLKVLDLKPGDVIVVESDRHLSKEQIGDIERYAGQAFPGHRVVVCDQGIRIKAARVAGVQE